MSVKDVAIQDIQSELEKEGKSFLAFRTQLDPVMDSLVSEQLQAQEKASYCLSGYSKRNG